MPTDSDAHAKHLSIWLAGGILASLIIAGSMNSTYGSDPATVWQRDPMLTTMAGERITELALGQQAVIGITTHNLRTTSQHVVVVIEVRDGNGFTEYLAWQGGVIEPDGDLEMQFSWSPRPTCEFYPDCEKREVRSFVITSIDKPAVLSVISTTSGITVSGIPTELPHLGQRYSVPLHDRMYNVTYSFFKGDGTIVDTEINRDARTLTLSLETRQDSRLVMAIQKPLFDYVIIGNTTQSVEPYVLVDGRDTPFTQLFDFKKNLVTYIVNVEERASQITLGGRVL